MATVLRKFSQEPVSTILMLSTIGVLVALIVGFTKANKLSDAPDEKGNVQVNSTTKRDLVETYRFSLIAVFAYFVYFTFRILKA